MTPPHLNMIALDPGGTTGICIAQVPRMSVYGSKPGRWLRLECREVTGDEDVQVDSICRIIREVQSLDYGIGPAVVGEQFDNDSPFNDDDVFSPVRIMAKLEYARHLGKTGDSKIVYQTRGMAKSTATDDRLRAWGLYEETVGSMHKRDATRHLITMLRRARKSARLRDRLWNSMDDGMMARGYTVV